MDFEVLTWAGATFAALLPLANPLNAIPLFAVMTGDLSDAERKRQATKAGLYTGAILLVTALAGAFILDFFGINLATLQVAGGLLVGAAAWAMVTGNPQVSRTETATWAREKRFSLRNVPRLVARSIEARDVSQLRPHRRQKHGPTEPAGSGAGSLDGQEGPAVPNRQTPSEPSRDRGSADAATPAGTTASPGSPQAPDSPAQESRESASPIVRDIAFSPVAMPLLAGPAAMGMVIGLTSQTTTLQADIGVLIGIGLITILAVYGLRAASPILHYLGASGILAFQRIFGFILLAIAVSLVANGISSLFGIPIYTD
jgi:small neutral amino acid transporter SnatA (MarC family)